MRLCCPAAGWVHWRSRRGAASPGPPRSLPLRGHGRPGGPLEGRAGGHKGWSGYACRSCRGASAEGQRWRLLAGCPAGARHHPGINRDRLRELRKGSQQRAWLRPPLLVGGRADVIPGRAWSWVSASHPRPLRNTRENFWRKHGQRKHFRDKHKLSRPLLRSVRKQENSVLSFAASPSRTVVPQGCV